SCPASNVSVLLGNGDGTFQAVRNFPVGEAPVSVAVGDFNGDGIPDLAIGNAGDPMMDGQPGSVSVLLGNGDGTFRPAASLSAGESPSSVAVGDFNRDGHFDLAVTDLLSGSVWVLLGNGDGSFQTGQSFPTDSASGSLPEAVAVGDLNGDSKPDLIVANNKWDTYSVLLGNGDGTFGPPVSFAAGGAPEAEAIGDFNGDGVLDLAGVNSASGTVSVLLGFGDGSLQAARSYPTNGPFFSLVAADFNGDGKLDVVTPGSLLLGNGDGTFQAPRTLVSGADPFSVAVGDFNGDGKLDLAVADNGSNNVYILLGNGDGTFQPALAFDVGAPARSVVVGDFNGDGKPDLAITNVGCLNCPPSTVAVLLGNGDGTFQTARVFAVGSDPQSVAVGDLNGDGKLDLVIADGVNGAIVLLGNGDGTFQQAQFLAAGTFPASVAVRDLNGDGKADLVVANSASGGAPGAVFLLLGNGDGTFQTAKNLSTLGDLWSVVVGDFNGDGKPDLAVASADAAYVLVGNGDGNFQAPQPFAASGDGLSIASGDFHGDGKLDLAISNDSSTLSVLRNNTVQAFFSLMVSETGDGGGTVTSNPEGINCGPNCAGAYASRAVVTLTARASMGSTFSGWSGCDAVSGQTCTVAMNAAKSVTAIFSVQRFVLRVNKRGNSGGMVTSTSTPANTMQINCGFTCSASYLWGTTVTLTTTPGAEANFLGWRGCDTVSELNCTVIMGATKSVMAIFISAPRRWPRRWPITLLRGT
ncbi:MAG TPA: FG-GAP-like repeat-containing protein, partial [Candidatus Sulfotelmatobacter sp.]|nr:FG-GAP-like repeat-containing protein [Candidatus Sulfotelmatobacter sp.]